MAAVAAIAVIAIKETAAETGYTMKIIKKLMSDPVLVAAWILAFISLFFTKPDKEYLSYIDWRSLGILWGLMVVIQGFKENGIFDRIGRSMLARVKKAGSWH